MSEIFILDSHLAILYGIGLDNRQHSEDLYACLARPDPRNHGGVRASLHSPSLASCSVLIMGAILARGKRTVTSALRAIGLAQERHFTNYHRVLNRAVWHASFAAKVLLGCMVALLPA